MSKRPRKPTARTSAASAALPEAGGGSARHRSTSDLHLVIITGLSGSGKGITVKAFEDFGYYCVDNLPLDLLPKFVELVQQSDDIRRAAAVVDIRDAHRLRGMTRMVQELRHSALRLTLLFLEASDEIILRRFSETRRPHPLATEGKVQQAIDAERKTMQVIRDQADLVVDTSSFNIHELRAFIRDRVVQAGAASPLSIVIGSFGFKHGLPPDSDLVFDVRFLPNPNYVAGFRDRTGRDRAVAKYIANFPQTREFIDRVTKLLLFLIPHYTQEGKSYLTISFGCTGGHHRSVFISEAVRRALRREGLETKITHRDIQH